MTTASRCLLFKLRNITTTSKRQIKNDYNNENKTMRILKQWVLVAALVICGTAAVFTSCSSNDDNAGNDNALAEKVMGKWMLIDSDGQAVITDRVSVYTFAKEGSALKAYFSIAMAESQTWLLRQQADVAVGNGSLTLTSRLANGSTAVVQMTDVSVSGSELTLTAKTTISVDGREAATYGPRREHFTRVNADYKAEDLIGTWDGYYACDDPAYNKPDPHQAVFRADGSCNYYYAVEGGGYRLDPTVYSKYFVDGSLLSLCWLDFGEGEREKYENWEILSVTREKIISRAFHKRPDGTIYTETYHLTKVN